MIRKLYKRLLAIRKEIEENPSDIDLLLERNKLLILLRYLMGRKKRK